MRWMKESWRLKLFLAIFLSSSFHVEKVESLNECLKGQKENTSSSPKPRRFFQLENDIYNITIETSEEIGHQLVSYAFKILLSEVLGYESVNILHTKDHFNTTAVLNRLSENRGNDFSTIGGRAPEAVINLGVWLSPETDLLSWTSRGLIESCGHLGFAGRYGWFTVQNENLLKKSSSLHVDYWRSYAQNPLIRNITKLFSLSPSDWAKAINLSRDNFGNYYCNESYCSGGVFEPPLCQNATNDDCAVLINSYPQSSSYLPYQILNLKLFVRVIYLGPNFESFVQYLLKKYEKNNEIESALIENGEDDEERNVLFFTWKPTLLTTDLSLISVSLPPCNEDSFCNYESGKLEKVVWSKLKDGAKLAFEATHRLSLTLEEYISYLELYKESIREDPNASIESVACKWINSNERIYNTWLSKAEIKKTPIYIGGIFPMSGNYTNLGAVIAANMATAAVNNNSEVLKDYELRLHISDGQCKADMVMKNFIDYIRLPNFSTMAGILGPACSDTVEPLAGVARHFKTVVISYSAEGSSFSDRATYPYFFRTIGENKEYQHVYLKLFKEFKWRRIASLTQEGQKYAEYVSHLQDLLQENNIAFIANRKYPKEHSSLNMTQYLHDLKSKKAKIIIGEFYDYAARAIMCEAYRQGMTGEEGYVWFLPVWYGDDWYDTQKYNILKKEQTPCSTAQMIKAINGHLSLQHAYFGEDESEMQEGMPVREWRNKYVRKCEESGKSTSEYAGYAYDAVWTYAYALDKLLRQNHSHIANLHSDNTTKNFSDIIKLTDFHGVSGHIRFNGGPSRKSIIHVIQWLNKNTTIVGKYNPDVDSKVDSPLVLNKSGIVWLGEGGEVPSDGSEPPPTCVLEVLKSALDVSCEIAIVIANIIGFGFLGLILLICFILLKRRYDMQVKQSKEYLRTLGVDPSAVSNASALEKWEIRRDRLVINRKIGEGAFGNVYGGECYLDDKGTWVNVAVKTLKTGLTLEQKLDFLAEAEVMKRFDHKNILKLLGVQTKDEPISMVLEHMLYGDLKNFLLPRRNLVNEQSIEDSDEISSKRLTSMALDVARAVSYLAELKYVHRDIACRNCLLTSNRVVKLGDFGMCRSMYENDYYRLNRKGLLPVRWMPPESIALGRFTPASDVWSFGVFLFELITFGSYPFAGLSNNQVVDYVKNGKVITIPHGVKPQLENLLLSTWSFNPNARPQASEIVEYLANNPRLIYPTLEMPLASVQLEDPDIHELQLPKSKKKERKIFSRKETTEPSSPVSLCPELIPLTMADSDNLALNLLSSTNTSQNPSTNTHLGQNQQNNNGRVINRAKTNPSQNSPCPYAVLQNLKLEL